MSTAEMVHELESLPENKRSKAIQTLLKKLYPKSRKAIERLLRRIEHPEIPEDVWEGFEEAEDGQTVDLDVALTQPYPGKNEKRGRV